MDARKSRERLNKTDAKHEMAKRLNLSNKSKAAQAEQASSSDEESVHSSGDEQQPQDESQEESGDESDEEFEIPPGFERVKGNSSMTQEAILSEDKELWFFKLPKNMDASALSSVTFKVGKNATPGEIVATVKHEGNKTFALQHEDPVLTMQLTNAFPVAADRTKFALGKPFTRCFSLLEDRSTAAATTPKKASKRKSLEPAAVAAAPTKAEKAPKAKKSKSKK